MRAAVRYHERQLLSSVVWRGVFGGAGCGGPAVVLSGFESVQGVADDRGGLVFGPPAVGLSERVDVGSERLAFLVGGSLDRAMQIGGSLSDGPADGVALAAHHSSFLGCVGVVGAAQSAGAP